jgi:heptaprenyl diphosphate synthase
VVDILDSFGRLFGVAFQIRDDVLDFKPANQTGKKYAQDIRNGIFTLPVLFASEGITDDMTELLEKKHKCECDVGSIVDWVVSTGSLDRAKNEAEKLFTEAETVIGGLGSENDIRKLNEVCESVYAV